MSIKDHFFHVLDYLILCANNGVAINAPKFKFCRVIVEFAGLTVTPNGAITSSKMVCAISDFPEPTHLISAQSWFGLIIQVAWAYSVSSVMQPFRDLIRLNQKCYCNDNLNKLFESSKQLIISLVKESSHST